MQVATSSILRSWVLTDLQKRFKRDFGVRGRMISRNKKMEKLRSILRRWHSQSRNLTRSYSELSRGSKDECHDYDAQQHEQNCEGDEEIPAGYEKVYVGQSRRKYVVSQYHLNHPLFKLLLEKSDDNLNVVPCEVVLFEHLLWMLKNADPHALPHNSWQELVQFYSV